MTQLARNARKVINILRKKKRKTIMNVLLWFIATRKNNKLFYMADFDHSNRTVLWSAQKDDAISFRTEKSLDNFVQQNLRSRNDIILVQTPYR